MDVFDFNIHLPPVKSNVDSMIRADIALSEQGLISGLNIHDDFISKNTGVNLLLFNTSLFDSDVSNFYDVLSRKAMRITTTALIDFRRSDIEDYIDVLSSQNVRCVMVNSYLQRIDCGDFDLVLRAFKYAASKGLILCVDGSYGTSKMLSYDNLDLMCYLSDRIENIPIVVIHSGGKRILDVMWLAMEKSNIWLDTSFSLPFYLGSSVEIDIAFAYKKLGSDRILYGSDLPYLNSKLALNYHFEFFEKFKFSDIEIERILCSNALELFNI